jgi:2-succinyl-6-hydroxy-2,4-cyclohexadiene-1-carboxylate synthase
MGDTMNKVKIYRNVAKLSNIDMFYLDTRTDGPVILCLHGLWGRGNTWYDFMQKYGSQYRIIAPDQRGHGLSSKPESKYQAEEMAVDLSELLDYLNLDSVILAGHSMGGNIAAHFTYLYPKRVNALAILDMPASGPAHNNMPLEQLVVVDPFTKDWPMPFATLSEAKAYIKQTAASELEYQYFMNSLTETVRGYEMMYSSQAIAAYKAYYEDWYHILPEIHCMVLLVRSGSHASVSDEDYEKMQFMLVNCIAREVSHPDHNVHLSNKEEFYGIFSEFLLRVQNNN